MIENIFDGVVGIPKVLFVEFLNVLFKASSLRRHLADMHSVYQQTVVAEEMLVCPPTKTHVVSEWSPAGLSCPFPECGGLLSSGWMMR
jgi:hypothetical protein